MVALLALFDDARRVARGLVQVAEALRLLGQQRAEALLELDPVPRRPRLLALARVEPRERLAHLRLELDVAPRELLDRAEELPLEARKRGPVVVEREVLADLLGRRRHQLRQTAERRRLVVERELRHEARERRPLLVEGELLQDVLSLLGEGVLDRLRELHPEAARIVRREQLEDGAPLAEVRRERSREQRVVGPHVCAEQTIELAVLARQRRQPLRQEPALRIEVLRQRRRHALGHLRGACREQVAHLARRAPCRPRGWPPRRSGRSRCAGRGPRRGARTGRSVRGRRRGRRASSARTSGSDTSSVRTTGWAGRRRCDGSGSVTGSSAQPTCFIARLPARLFSTAGRFERYLATFPSLSPTPQCRSSVRDTARASRSVSPTRTTERRARVIAV